MLKILKLDLSAHSNSSEIINSAYKGGVSLSAFDFGEFQTGYMDPFHNGQFVLLRSGSQSALTICDKDADKLIAINTKDLDFQDIRPRDVAQTCMMYAIKHSPMCVAMGLAGSGKTTIALAYAVEALMKQSKKIVLCKPTTFVGMRSNAIAPVPGDHREKMAGYIDSYLYTFKRLLGNHAAQYLDQLEGSERLIFKPLELIRGLHFEDSVVILDEAQNTSPHELLSLISRVADTSKLIIMGDPWQIDTGVPFDETGLGVLISSDSFLDSPYAMGVVLESQYRGKLAQLSYEVLREISSVEIDED